MKISILDLKNASGMNFTHLGLSRIAYLREPDVVAHANVAKEVVK